jgi:predicted lipoprotein with Yx(FWY)xxD motif
MQKYFALPVLAAATLAFAAAAMAETTPPALVGKTAKGKTLVDQTGMTLYVFDKDKGGKSACNDSCAANWPPLMVTPGAEPSGDYTITQRDDSTSQWAYKGRPLYTWRKDMQPGDITGDGVNNTWHVATP